LNCDIRRQPAVSVALTGHLSITCCFRWRYTESSG